MSESGWERRWKTSTWRSCVLIKHMALYLLWKVFKNDVTSRESEFCSELAVESKIYRKRIRMLVSMSVLKSLKLGPQLTQSRQTLHKINLQTSVTQPLYGSCQLIKTRSTSRKVRWTFDNYANRYNSSPARNQIVSRQSQPVSRLSSLRNHHFRKNSGIWLLMPSQLSMDWRWKC